MQPQAAHGWAAFDVFIVLILFLVGGLQAWSWQKQRVAELCSPSSRDRQDTVFLLQVCAQTRKSPFTLTAVMFLVQDSCCQHPTAAFRLFSLSPSMTSLERDQSCACDQQLTIVPDPVNPATCKAVYPLSSSLCKQ
jgi:hypothetical protein